MKAVMVDALVGSEYSLCLCSSLKPAGVDITLVVTEDRDEKVYAPFNVSLKKWLPSKNPTRSKSLKTLKYVQYLSKLLWFVLSNRVRVVHFQFFRLPRIESLFYLLLRVLRINLAYTAHDVWPPEKKKMDFLFLSIVYRASNVIFVHSEHIATMLIENFSVNRDKVKIVPHGNSDHYLPLGELPRGQARRQLHLRENDHVLLFFGNIREYKGLDLLLDAFELAAKTNPRLQLVIAGAPLNQELKERYAEQIDALSSKERILYHAEFIPTEKVAEYFVAGDVVVLPYRNIYHSGVLHLAYSFGKPVLATKVGDFPETIEHGKSGYLLEESGAKCLAHAIAKLFSEPETLKEMGKYARKLSEEKYSWKAIAEKMRSEYSRLAQSHQA